MEQQRDDLRSNKLMQQGRFSGLQGATVLQVALSCSSDLEGMLPTLVFSTIGT